MTENRKFTLYHTLRRIAAPHLVVSRSTYRLIRLTINPFNDNNILINIDKYFDTKTGGRSTDTAASSLALIRFCTSRRFRRRAWLPCMLSSNTQTLSNTVLLICYSTIFLCILRHYATIVVHIQRMSCHSFRYIFNGPLAACVRFVRDPYTKII